MGLPGLSGGPAVYDLNNRHPGSLVNSPTWAVMPNGLGWLSLTAASDQYVNLGNPAALQITGAMSVVLRYRLRTAPADTTGYQLVAKDADTGGRAYTFDLYRQGTNVPGSGLRFYVNGGGLSSNLVAEGRLPATDDDRWVCGTFTPSASGGLKIYVDGALVASNAGTTDASIPSASTSVLIGRRGYTGYTEPFNGWIGDVRIYNWALSATQVRFLYDQHRSGHPDLIRRDYPSALPVAGTVTTAVPFQPAYTAGFGW